MRLLTNNKITADMITANNESVNFPKENMINNTLIEKCYFNDYSIIDFGIAITIDAVRIVSNDSLVLQANNTNTWSAPAYQLILTDQVQFISETYQYWRIITPGYISPYLIAEYSTGTDANITNPETGTNTPTNFIPIKDSAGRTYLTDNTTNEGWRAFPTYWSATTGTASVLYFNFSGDLTSSNTWTTFESSGSNGLKTFTFPGAGGYIEYYYDYDAWYTALNGLDASLNKVFISQNGSVYLNNNIGNNSYLIVRWDGVPGSAGGGSAQDTERPLAPTVALNINYIYLGEYMQATGAEAGSTPNTKNTDIVNISNMGVIQSTPGITYKEQEFKILADTQSDYDKFMAWYESADRVNNFFIVQFEDDLDTFEPFFCKLIDYIFNERYYLNYTYTIKVREAK